MQIECNLRDFLNSFIIDGGTEISIYDEDKLLVEYKPVGDILTLPKYKRYLSKKVSYISLDHYNDMTWLMITILRNQK